MSIPRIRPGEGPKRESVHEGRRLDKQQVIKVQSVAEQHLPAPGGHGSFGERGVELLREATPPEEYVALDGPSPGDTGEQALPTTARALANASPTLSTSSSSTKSLPERMKGCWSGLKELMGRKVYALMGWKKPYLAIIKFIDQSQLTSTEAKKLKELCSSVEEEGSNKKIEHSRLRTQVLGLFVEVMLQYEKEHPGALPSMSRQEIDEVKKAVRENYKAKLGERDLRSPVIRALTGLGLLVDKIEKAKESAKESAEKHEWNLNRAQEKHVNLKQADSLLRNLNEFATNVDSTMGKSKQWGKDFGRGQFESQSMKWVDADGKTILDKPIGQKLTEAQADELFKRGAKLQEKELNRRVLEGFTQTGPNIFDQFPALLGGAFQMEGGLNCERKLTHKMEVVEEGAGKRLVKWTGDWEIMIGTRMGDRMEGHPITGTTTASYRLIGEGNELKDFKLKMTNLTISPHLDQATCEWCLESAQQNYIQAYTAAPSPEETLVADVTNSLKLLCSSNVPFNKKEDLEKLQKLLVIAQAHIPGLKAVQRQLTEFIGRGQLPDVKGQVKLIGVFAEAIKSFSPILVSESAILNLIYKIQLHRSIELGVKNPVINALFQINDSKGFWGDDVDLREQLIALRDEIHKLKVKQGRKLLLKLEKELSYGINGNRAHFEEGTIPEILEEVGSKLPDVEQGVKDDVTRLLGKLQSKLFPPQPSSQ